MALPQALGFGRRFLPGVACGVAHERPSVALAHHPCVEIEAVNEAHCQGAPVPVAAVGLAGERVAADLIRQRPCRFGSAGPGSKPCATAGLRRLGSIDAFEPHVRVADGDDIAVDDAGLARERAGGIGATRACDDPGTNPGANPWTSDTTPNAERH